MRRAGLALVFAGAVLGGALPAGGEPLRARLVYVRGPAAEACPDERAIRDAIAAELGADPFDDSAPEALWARIEPGGGGLQAVVEVRDATGVVLGARTVASEAADCEALARAMVLAIVIAIDPARFAGLPAPAPAPAPPAAVEPPRSPAAAPAVRATARPPRTLRPRRARPLGLEASASARVSFGVLPAPALGVAVGVAAGSATWSLGLEARLDPSVSAEAAGGGRVAASLLGLAVLSCVRRETAGPTLAACALATAGVMFGRGEAVPEPASDSGPWLAVGVRLAVGAPFGRLWLGLHLDGLANLVRTRLELDGDPAWTAPPFALAPGAALAVRFL